MLLANKPYGSFILGFLCAVLLPSVAGMSGLRADNTGMQSATGTQASAAIQPASTELNLDGPTESVPVAAMQAARLWADLLTDGWEHIIDPIGFDEMTAEYCVLRRHAVRGNAGPYGELAAAESVNDWARYSLGYEHRASHDQQTVAALVVSMGYGCTSVA